MKNNFVFQGLFYLYFVWLGFFGCSMTMPRPQLPSQGTFIGNYSIRINAERTYTVRFDRRLSQDRIEAMEEIIPEFERIGVHLVTTTNTHTPDVYVRFWINAFPLSDMIGLYIHGYNHIYIDPIRATTRIQLQRTFAHEVGHRFGLEHVCRYPYESKPTPCSNIGFGEAVMNPYIAPYTTVRFTNLDLLEASRHH
jgi:hypothetical protein